MSDRREEGRFLARLRGEIAAWRGEGVITPEQEGRLRARYDFSLADREVQAERNRAVAILTLAGAALVGVGVILFFAANWPHIPRWWRFSVVLLGMAGLYAAAWELGWRRGRFPFTGRALAVAGCLLFGAGIWLIAQTFNISSHWPNGILLWALGTLPVAAALGASPLLSLYTVLLTAWTLSETGGFDRGNPWFFPLALATVLPLAYLRRLRFPVGLAVVGITAALAMDSPHWGLAWEGPHRETLAGFLMVMGAWAGVLALVGRLHGPGGAFAPFAILYRFPALLLLGFVLPFFTFREAVEDFLRDGAGVAVKAFLLAAAVAAVLLFAALWRRWREGLRDPATAAVALEGAAAADSALWLAAFALGGGLLPAWGWALFWNLHLLGLSAALVFCADRTREWWAGYLGVILFTALAVCRYFEYGVRLLPKSLVFLAAGGVLLAGGVWLERRRRGSREVAR